MEFQMSASMVLVGAALAIAGIFGVLQPPGQRGVVLFALAAGMGVGIVGLGLGLPTVSDGPDDQFWWVFFLSSIGGFTTVIAVLALTWRRARSSGSRSGAF
jgi:ABC-type Fe3+-siderophore transport system permease subunit